jgi:protein-tyrosine-phosphatase
MHPETTGFSRNPSLRGVFRWLRHFPERALHGVRHRAAVSRLHRRPLPRAVVMICHGNICRSPYAAMALKRQLPPSLAPEMDIQSAGLVKPDRRCPPEARAAAAQRQIDLSTHFSRVVTGNLLEKADLIVVMEPGQARALRRDHGIRPDALLILGDLDPRPVARRPIRDPVEQPLDVFEEVYDRIDRCVTTMVRAFRSANATSLESEV